jgi:HEAT repeats
MSWSRVLLVPLVVLALAPAAPAGLFSRKQKSNAAERVPQVLIQLQTAQDEGRRAAAAEELRQYDAKEFPKIIPTLIDALNRDASPAVRAEAAVSLGRLRPISQQAGFALEQAQNNDAVMRVRLAARQSLWQYHLVGYRGGKSADVSAAGGNADSSAAMPRPMAATRGASHYPGVARETAEPPLAMPDNPRPRTPPPAPPAPRPAPPTQDARPSAPPPSAGDGPALPSP